MVSKLNCLYKCNCRDDWYFQLALLMPPLYLKAILDLTASKYGFVETAGSRVVSKNRSNTVKFTTFSNEAK